MFIAFLFARVYAGQSVNESTCGSNFWICGQNPLVWPLKSPSAVLLEGTIYFIMLLKHLTLWTKFYSVIIQMKPLWLYFRMLLFVFQYLIKWTLDLLVLLLRKAFLSVKGLNFSWSCFAELSWGQIIWGRNCNITGVDISCSSWELLFIYYYYHYRYYYYYYYYYHYHYYYLYYYYDSQKTEMKSSGEKWET